MDRIEAVVLSSLAFKDYDRILTLFSPQGILKLYVRGSKRHYLQQAALTSPLTQADFHFLKGKKELHRFVEGAIVRQNLQIRESYTALMAADKMVQGLLSSQWPGKEAPQLYQLFTLFLERLPKAPLPDTLSLVFLLKILRHEGILQLSAPFEDGFRYGGEKYEEGEAPAGALFFTRDEEGQLAELVLCRSMVQIEKEIFSSDFQKKISMLFAQAFE